MDQIHPHMDGAESVFFLRELEHIYAGTFDILFPELLFRQMIPVSNEANEGAETVTYQQFNRHGKAKFVSSKAKDIPRIDVNGVEFPRPVRLAADSYAWDVNEVKAAAMAGRDLNPRRANAARRSVEELLDETAALGSPDDGIVSGFFNEPAVAIDAAAGPWEAATADEIIDDITDMQAAMDVDTKDVEKATDLVLPSAKHTIIRNRQRSSGSDLTVLKWIEQNLELRVTRWYRANTAGAGGIPRAVLYNNSPEKLTQELPMEYQTLPVQAQGMELVVIAMAKTAGTNFYYPRSARYLDGL